MGLEAWQKKFREGFTGQKESGPKKYEDMTKEEKEKYLRERNKKQSFSGFADGGNVASDDPELYNLLNKVMSGNTLKSPVIDEQDQINAQTSQINDKAESPYQQTKPERVVDEIKQEAQKTPIGQASESQDDTLQRYKKAISDYQTRLNEKKEPDTGDSVMNWLTGIGQGADVFNRNNNKRTQNVKYWGDKVAKKEKSIKQNDLSGLEKLQNMYSKYLQTQGKSLPKTLSKLDEAKIENVKAKTNTEEAKADKLKKEADKAKISWEEKEQKKFEFKQKLIDKKEKSKDTKQTVEAISNLDSQIEKVRRAKKLLADSVKNSSIADTGPLDQYISGSTAEGQILRQAFNDLSLDKMTKMFKGMSKAIDSDAERKMFEQSQASLGNYPEVNMKVLDNMEKGMLSLKEKNQGLLTNLEQGSTKKIIQKQYSPSRNQTRITYDDGSTEILDGK